jgi:hypothetical protein
MQESTAQFSANALKFSQWHWNSVESSPELQSAIESQLIADEFCSEACLNFEVDLIMLADFDAIVAEWLIHHMSEANRALAAHAQTVINSHFQSVARQLFDVTQLCCSIRLLNMSLAFETQSLREAVRCRMSDSSAPKTFRIVSGIVWQIHPVYAKM